MSPAPLYVDLDGTLVATDTLWESLLALLRRRPARLLLAPLWLAGGRAGFKAQVARHIQLPAERLPYRSAVVDELRSARAAGRRVVLATASDRAIAEAVARHLALFDAVIASDGRHNRGGHAKLEAIQRDALAHGCAGFEYLGDAVVDLPIWQSAGRASLVAPSRAAARAVRATGLASRTLVGRNRLAGPLLRVLSPGLWGLAWLPVAAALSIPGVEAVRQTAIVSAVLAGASVLRELAAIETDRGDPERRARPLASGQLPIAMGLASVALAGSAALLLAAL